MRPKRRKLSKDATVVSNQERILRDGHHIAAASSAATSVLNPIIVPQSSEAVLQKVVTPIWRAEGVDTFSGLVNRPVLQERPTSRIWLKHTTSLARLESPMSEQISSIPVLVENAMILLFKDADRFMESSPDRKMISVIQTLAGRALAKSFRSTAFYSAVGDAVQKCVTEPPSVDAAAVKIIDAPSLSAPVRQ